MPKTERITLEIGRTLDLKNQNFSRLHPNSRDSCVWVIQVPHAIHTWAHICAAEQGKAKHSLKLAVERGFVLHCGFKYDMRGVQERWLLDVSLDDRVKRHRAPLLQTVLTRTFGGGADVIFQTERDNQTGMRYPTRALLTRQGPELARGLPLSKLPRGRSATPQGRTPPTQTKRKVCSTKPP